MMRFIKGLLFCITQHSWQALTFLFTNFIANGSVSRGMNAYLIGAQRHDVREIGEKKLVSLWSRNGPEDLRGEK